jgi:hypothetical protein
MALSTQPDDPTSRPQAIRARLDKFDSIQAFSQGYRNYFFRNGILLPTRQVKPLGTSVSLKLEIANGEVVLRAEGRVQDHRHNADGQPVGMVIRFDRVDPACQPIIDAILQEQAALRSGRVPTVSRPEGVPTVPDLRSSADFEAIAEELESSFDSIFGSGMFRPVDPEREAEAEDQAPTALRAPTLLQRPGALALQAAQADDEAGAEDAPWMSTLDASIRATQTGAFVQVAGPAADTTPPVEETAPSSEADQLLRAFGLSSTDSDGLQTDDPSEDPRAQPIGRIQFQRRAPGEPSSEPTRPQPIRARLSRPEGEVLDEEPLASLAGPPRPAPPGALPRPPVPPPLRTLIERITSDHAIIPSHDPVDPLHQEPEVEIDPMETDGDAGNHDAGAPTVVADLPVEELLALSRPAVTPAPPPPAVPVRPASAQAPPEELASLFDEAPMQDDEPVSAAAADTALATARPLVHAPPSRPMGLLARLWAFLLRLFGRPV